MIKLEENGKIRGLSKENLERADKDGNAIDQHGIITRVHFTRLDKEGKVTNCWTDVKANRTSLSHSHAERINKDEIVASVS